MATLFPYISEGAQAGQRAQMRIRKLIWLTVGHGTVAALSDFEVDINGRVELIVYKGDLRIHLILLDQDPEALSGPCILHLNAHVDEKASYRVSNGALTVSAAIAGKKATVSLSRHENGKMTECELTGFLDITVYLEAEAT